MFKKISALFLVCASLIGNMPVQARLSITDTNEQEKVLNALGIRKEFAYKVTEGDFLEFIAELIYKDVTMTPSQIADSIGVLDEGEIFDETTRITYERALKFAVIALGYKVMAVTDDKYYSIASELRLTDNISLNSDDVLTRDTARQLLMNMLEAEPMRQALEKGEMVYKRADGETLLSLDRDIIITEGIVTANSITSIDEEKGASEGYIEINGKEYLAEGDFDNLLGKYVYGFVKTDAREDDTIIYLSEKENKNTVLEIKTDNCEEIKDRVLTYTEDEDETKLKRAKLDINLKVIYNGVFYGDYEDYELIPENGELTLVDNNNDEKFDIAFVTSYQTMIVASAVASDKRIINAYHFPTSLNTLSLDDEENNVLIKLYDENGAITFSDIKADDILTVAKSKTSTPQVITVYRSSDVIEGVVKTKNDEKKLIQIDDTEYPYLEELELDATAEGKNLTIGKKYKFYIDYFGNVAYAEYINEFDYYVFYKCYEEADEYYVSYMDINEKWNTVPLSKKITMDNTPMSSDSAYQRLVYYEPQVVQLHINSKNELKEIQFAKTSDESSQLNFVKKDVSNLAYRLTPKSFGGEIWLEDDALMFVFPQNSKDKTKYSVENANGAFEADTQYIVTAYDFDDFGFTHILSMQEKDNKKTPNPSLFLVTDVFTTCVDDEVFTAVKGSCADFTVYQLNGEDENTFKGVEPGDVIRVHTNRNGRIDEVSTCIKTSSDKFVKKRSHLGNTIVYNRTDITTGIIDKIDIPQKKVKIDAGEKAVFRLSDTIAVTIYDRSTRTCKSGKFSDLTVGDMLVCKTGYLQLQEVFVIRN